MRILVDSSASTMQACNSFQRDKFPALLTLYFAAGIGISNFPLAFFIMSLISIIKINEVNTRNFLASPRFGFSTPRLLFSSLRSIRHIFPSLWHKVSGLEVVCFLVSLHPDHVHPSDGFSYIIVNLVEPIHESDNSPSRSTFQ